MIYLNVILTIICLTLISFLVFGIFIVKKFGKKFMDISESTATKLFDPKQMEQSLNMLNNLFRNK